MTDIQFDIRGLDSTVIGIQAQSKHLRDEIIDIVRSAALQAEVALNAFVPERSGRLRSTIKVGGIIYSPGGPGGGGYYEVDIEVGEGVDYLEWVYEGTGERAGHGTIFPKTKNFMQWKDEEGTTRLFQSRGQAPKQDWITDAHAEADELIRGRIAMLDLEQ